MKIVNLVAAIWTVIAKYPAVTAGLFNVIIIAGAQVGLHLTSPQLASLAGCVAGVFALLVHIGVIPVTKVANVKAGIKPTVPNAVVTAPVAEIPLETDKPVRAVPSQTTGFARRIVPPSTKLIDPPSVVSPDWKRGKDVSSMPDPPMDDLPAPRLPRIIPLDPEPIRILTAGNRLRNISE